MDAIKKTRGRGRPRRFDPDAAVTVAKRLFHERGYDAVSVADLTEALSINPPSFYAAFGSKAALYRRVLCRFSEEDGVPLAEILLPGRPVAEALSALLIDAARRYAAKSDVEDGIATGCLVIEGGHCVDPDARAAARDLSGKARAEIEAFIAAAEPQAAERLADYTVTVMIGLSGMARQGASVERLVEAARLAGAAYAQALER